MLTFESLDALRDFLDVPPGAPVTTGAVLGWLAEGGLAERGTTKPVSGAVTVIVFGDHGDRSASVYAVPDSAITPDVRAALESGTGRVFATEEVVGDDFAGPLWLLALLGRADASYLRHLAQGVPSVNAQALLAAREASRHGAFEPHWTDSLGALRGASITACYTGCLAH